MVKIVKCKLKLIDTFEISLKYINQLRCFFKNKHQHKPTTLEDGTTTDNEKYHL